jgi:hypothetical protein
MLGNAMLVRIATPMPAVARTEKKSRRLTPSDFAAGLHDGDRRRFGVILQRLARSTWAGEQSLNL